MDRRRSVVVDALFSPETDLRAAGIANQRRTSTARTDITRWEGFGIALCVLCRLPPCRPLVPPSHVVRLAPVRRREWSDWRPAARNRSFAGAHRHASRGICCSEAPLRRTAAGDRRDQQEGAPGPIVLRALDAAHCHSRQARHEVGRISVRTGPPFTQSSRPSNIVSARGRQSYYPDPGSVPCLRVPERVADARHLRN